MSDKDKKIGELESRRSFGGSSRSFPFVIKVNSIAGGTVKEACFAAIELSRHLRCMVETEINDTNITVCGAVMNGDDAYEQWHHYSKDNQDTPKNAL